MSRTRRVRRPAAAVTPSSPAGTRVAALVAAVSLSAFVLLAALAWERDAGLGPDNSIADFLNDIAPVHSDEVHVDPVLKAITLGTGAFSLALMALLLWRRRVREAFFLATSIGGAIVLSSLAKAIVARPAIEGPRDEWSFPSGSATWSLATAGAFVVLASSASERTRRWSVALGALLVLGYGSVIAYEQWHHPSDVLAGWCLALACVATAWLVFLRPAA